ncbi:MAG: hypothetical protein ACLFRG_07500 [Desulfococcaceae bacterium]
MARSRLFLTPEDHDHFLRIFPEARALPWTHFPEKGYWQVEFDSETPTPAETAALGENRRICLERLERLGHAEPPAMEDEVRSASGDSAYDGDTEARPRIVRPFLLLLPILVMVGGATVFLVSRNPDPSAVIPRASAPTPPDASQAEPAGESVGVETPSLRGDIIALLDRCRRFLQDGELTNREAGNALDCYREVLRHVPDNMEARSGLRRIEQHFIARTETALKRGEPGEARRHLAILDRVNPDSAHLARLWASLERLRDRMAAPSVPPESAILKNAPETPPLSPDPPAPGEEPASGGATAPSPTAAKRPPEAEKASEEARPGQGKGPAGGFDTDTLIRESLGTGFGPPEASDE